ncbi:Calx-beta domain-containing protein [Pseudoalteromonas sp. SS15]|uniref:Calx-beta domain-containing protein n=1 Tax=Pseudoalteromonas sp. SS15 TaxID=3139393 RepID=UPI003BAC878A
MYKSFMLSSLAIAISTASLSLSANECKGELYGINAGRGETGILFKLDDQLQTVKANSVAKFSSAALAYDAQQNRIYYVSAPRALAYKVDIGHLNLSSADKKHLPIAGDRFKYTKLAYFDVETQTHTEVGRTKGVISLVFDKANNRLIGSSFSALYEINPQTGEYTKLADLGVLSGKYRGDLAFYNDELILVTSTSAYQVDTSDYSLKKLSKHHLTAVTGATVDHAGNLIISRTKINDFGQTNKSELFKLNPHSGNTCFISEVPVRLNDLTTNTSETTTCYTAPLCETDPLPIISLSAIEDTVTEGQTLSFAVSLSNSYYQDVEVEVSAIEGSATSDDFTFPTQIVTFDAGDTNTTIEIPTIDNDEYSETKTFSIQATASLNSNGSVNLPAMILNDDAECIPVPHTKINYQFVSESAGYNNDWGIKVNNQFIKLLDEYGGSGSYQLPSSAYFDYALALNGNASKLTNNFRWHGQTQYWEDQNDADYNDFVVRVWTEQIQVGCN